jgi:hypothetical protein
MVESIMSPAFFSLKEICEGGDQREPGPWGVWLLHYAPSALRLDALRAAMIDCGRDARGPSEDLDAFPAEC